MESRYLALLIIQKVHVIEEAEPVPVRCPC